MKILLAGQKWFGAEVFRAVRKIEGVEIAAVSSPVGTEKEDKLTVQANLVGVPIIPAGSLRSSNIPDGIDLIVAAHSHDFISEKTRLRSRYGGIGYHPSLLPLHRGRDSVRWSIRMRESVTGGTVYRLSNRMDGGNILAQEHVFIRPDDTAEELWRRDLCPLGVRLLSKVVTRLKKDGHLLGIPQDEELATWEPSIDRPPAFRPDLLLLPDANRHSA
jgi:methionyl-tRNA formyltransferase